MNSAEVSTFLLAFRYASSNSSACGQIQYVMVPSFISNEEQRMNIHASEHHIVLYTMLSFFFQLKVKEREWEKGNDSDVVKIV